MKSFDELFDTVKEKAQGFKQIVVEKSSAALSSSSSSSSFDEIFDNAKEKAQGFKQTVIEKSASLSLSTSSSSRTFSTISKDDIRDKYNEITDTIEEKLQTTRSISKDVLITKLLVDTTEGNIILGTCCVLSFAIGFKAGRYQPIWKRYTQISNISNDKIGYNSPLLRGRVLSVSDGDGIRFLHAPIPYISSTKLVEGKQKEKLSDVALPIRIATIDAPEIAKFGNEGQPFAEEAKEYLSNKILNKIVHVQILSKDQYGRGVGNIIKPRMFPFNLFMKGTYMDEYMLKAGLAEVYRGSGAVYGPKGLEEYNKMEEKAKQQGRGIWSNTDRESAAEYKARIKS